MDDIFETLSKNHTKPDIGSFDGHFDPIIPFDQLQTPEIPSALLPPVLGDFVQNVSEVLLVPMAMPVLTVLGIVSAALAKKFIVSPLPDWKEPINIYCQIAMLPASNKSQTLKFLKSPVDDWEKKGMERVMPERDKALTNLKLLQTDIGKQYKILKNQKAKQADIDAAKEAVARLEADYRVKQEAVPVIPQIYTTDATPEAMAELIHSQGGRLAVISDEGGITEVLAGLYNSGNANIDIFLKGIDGGATRIKRANKDYSLNPYLTLVLLIQPQILSNMAEKRAYTGNGALERYLYALPVGNVGYREFQDRHIDMQAQTAYSNLVFNLLSIPVPETPYILKLDSSAKATWDHFRQEIERELRADGKLYICRGWGGKLAGYTLRLAGLMHVAEHDSTTHLVISHATMQKAIQLARLLMEHAVAAYNMMGADTETNDAKELFEWLKTKRTDRHTKSHIINAMHSRHMGKKGRLDKALSVLIQRNIISDLYCDKSTKKPTNVYFVNPEIFK